MEASGGISKGSGGDHQVRRLHIIYFLSHMGKFEQPHLLRIHHLQKNGVHLRDVKRWLADLRGKDMPEAFAWSYKRKYKNGYVWQDLTDDDLITPICDNEYVLKGSDISHTSPVDACSFVAITKDCSQLKADRKVQAGCENHKEKEEKNDDTTPRGSCRYCPKISSTGKSFSEIYEESPVFSSDGSTLTEENNKLEEQEEDLIRNKEKYSHQQGRKLKNFSPSSYFSTILLGDKENKEKKMRSNHKDGDIRDMESADKVDTPNFSFSSHSGLAENKSSSGRASKIFRNLMNCGAIDTNDDVLKPMNDSVRPKNGKKDCNLDHNKGRGLTRDSWNQRDNQPRRSVDGLMGSRKEQKTSGNGYTTGRIPAAYKPVGAPTCLQCGKSFRPEKLNTHMKSCRGMKPFTKAASAHAKKKMQFHDSQADPLHHNHQIVAIP